MKFLHIFGRVSKRDWEIIEGNIIVEKVNEGDVDEGEGLLRMKFIEGGEY